jgi:hypothetical protein
VKRSPMPPRAKPFPRSPWLPTRRRQTASEAVYRGRRAILLQEGCRVCGKDAEDVHHRKLRSQGGDHSWANLMPVCRRDHDQIHRNPAISHAAGWIVLRNEDPWRIRVLNMWELPTAQRIRFIRPVFDWAAIREAIDEENAMLGPEWGTF